MNIDRFAKVDDSICQQKCLRQSIHHSKQQGMTLIEILIAMLLGAFLLAGVLQIFINTKQTYRMQEGLSRLQENGRFAMEFLTYDIRMSGFLGCNSSAALNIIADPKAPNPKIDAPIPIPSANAVSGNNNVTNNWSTFACSDSNACIAGTDAITLYSANSCGGKLVGNMTTANANIQINGTNTCNNQTYDVLVVSDCSNTDIFVASNVSSGGGIETTAHANNQNSSNFLSKAYGPDAELLKFNSSTYFIRTGASGQPALWKLDDNEHEPDKTPVELVEGIEDMQITYGVDTDADGTPNSYLTANNIITANWPLVVSVRISLLARTLADNLSASAVAYDYNGANDLMPTDRRLRRVFSTTVALRNRLR
jgi:type IV pilus assembly protein PilW